MSTDSGFRYIDREKSWLAFNARVLQEAADEAVPLLERLRFIGIFSNNLDEFFRVRFAAIRRLSMSGQTGEKILGGISAQQLVKDITEIVIKQQAASLHVLNEIEKELVKQNIIIINENEVSEEHENFLKDFFIQKISPELVTIILNDLAEFPLLKDTSGYLAVKLVMKSELKSGMLGLVKKVKPEVRYAIIEIPKNTNRIVELPIKDDKQYLIMLDDLIRYNLSSIFNIFDYESISAHMIKITRDAQLDIDSDMSKSMLEKIATSVKDRRIGEPVRFVYDEHIGKDTLKFFLSKMGIDASDGVIPGGRYHNRRDYMNFPNLGRFDLLYPPRVPLPVEGLSLDGSLLNKIAKKDYLINAPFQSFSYLIKFLREAALDPKVTTIKITFFPFLAALISELTI